MRFLVDAQLPPALARWLASQTHDAEHVGDRGLQNAPDAAIWKHAAEHGCIILTKDEDFAVRRTLDLDGPAVVWIRRGNTTRAELLRWFSPLLPKVVEALQRGERLIEIS